MVNATRGRLVLHIGQTKAGSTAIQNYLYHERTALLRYGALFPSTGFSRANPYDMGRTAGHLELVRMIARNDPQDRQLLNDIQAAKILILSAENLFLDRPDNELLALSNFTSSYDLTIVLIVRSASGWFVSRYIEDVMSGFRNRTATFQQIYDERIRARVHDYASRLQYLCDIFQPTRIRLLNYDALSEGECLIPEFLSVAGIPNTNPILARTQKSNCRERWDFKIEGKRRLNYTIGKLPLPIKLESEQVIKKASLKIASRSVGLSPFPFYNLGFSPEVSEQIKKSNRRLTNEFGLFPKLPEPIVSQLPIENYRRILPEADSLVTLGLKAAARSLQNSFRPIEKEEVSTVLSISGCDRLIEVLEKHRVTVHLDSPKTAVWAASYSNRLSIFLTKNTPLPQADKLLSMQLPSDILLGLFDDAKNRVISHHKPSLVVAHKNLSVDLIMRYWSELDHSATLALIDYGIEDVSKVTDRLGLSCRWSSSQLAFLEHQ